MNDTTLPPSIAFRTTRGSEGVPGVVVVFSSGAPTARAIQVTGDGIEIKRGDAAQGGLDDGRVSRRHARITFDGGRCIATDLGSQNGTIIDGTLVAAHTPTPVERVLRAGDSLVIPCADIRPFEHWRVHSIGGFVRGPAMQELLVEVSLAAQSGATLHVRGENGTGKEGIAQAFHSASGRAGGPMIAVNCATIPQAIAERLLFGARRGAYSGADNDTPGYVQEADGGTLFLDEIAELDLQVQAKLLRVLESREVLALGALKSRKIDFALCSATSKDLRALVTAGAMREDLYFRIGRPAVVLPALRNRPEEIPALIAQELARLSPALTAHVSLVEQCLLRPWPGNVRELLAEIRIAAQSARADGGRVEGRHLAGTAGTVFGAAMPEAHAPPDAPRAPPAHAAGPLPVAETPRKRAPNGAESRERIEAALRANGGNVAATARALGFHRTQLRRLVERFGITVDTAVDGSDDDTG